MGVVLTNEPGDKSWPVTSATFILVHKVQDKPAQGESVLKFFDWAFKSGQKSASDLDYVPLPDAVTTQIRASWGEIKSAGRQGRLEVTRVPARPGHRVPGLSLPKESPSMSAVVDNNVPIPHGADVSAVHGTPSPMKQNNNALMDALFKNLTRLACLSGFQPAGCGTGFADLRQPRNAGEIWPVVSVHQ